MSNIININSNFTSLEHTIFLINNIIDSKNSDFPSLKYINKLLNDLTKLLNKPDDYDIEIKIRGEDQDNVKIFKAHSNILKARSSYFKAALSNNWIKRSDNGTILLEKKNIRPSIFEILLK